MPRAIRCLLIAVTAALLVSANAFGAQTHSTLVVVVSAQDTGVPLPNAMVRLPALRRGALTGPSGVARMSHVPPGTHIVVVEHLGYRSVERVLSVTEGQAVRTELELPVRPVTLDEIRVRVRRASGRLSAAGFYDRKKIGLGTYLERSDIEARALRTGRISNVLRTVPGLRIQQVGGRSVPVSTRSVGSTLMGAECVPQIYLDGVVIDRNGIDIDRLLPLTGIEGMEIYSGPSRTPAQYGGTDRSCGVVLIWTRSGS